ncbi:hypothetical protein [Dysgonomonas macrotermitis]|nr:hypothetical protein [Dysgonomonas macrotermitis]
MRVIDFGNQPVEGVYVRQGDGFWHSDKDGIIHIGRDKLTPNDTLYFSHLSYRPEKYLFHDLKFTMDTATIYLEDELIALKEVVVSEVFDAKKYMKEVIRKIPENYSDPFDDNLVFDTELLYKKIGEENTEQLIDYKGIIQLNQEEKDLYIAKKPEREYVSDELKQNVFFMKPYDFLNIIPIQKHDVVRYYKSYSYDNFEHINYKGRQSLKIYYQDKKRNGYLIIDEATQAILYVSYSVEATGLWTVGTMKKRGVVTTGIRKYHVEAEYVQNKLGKYIFDSGRENVDSYSKWKKNSVSNTYDVYLKRRSDSIQLPVNKKVKIKEIF